MNFPEYMTEQDIMDFEFELTRIIDTERGEGQFWAENAECQIVAALQRELIQDGQEPFYYGA